MSSCGAPLPTNTRNQEQDSPLSMPYMTWGTNSLTPKRSWLMEDHISIIRRFEHSVKNVASSSTLWRSTHHGSTGWWRAQINCYWVYHLCAPDLGEDDYTSITDFTKLPNNWPNHLDEAVCQLNRRILPSLKFSPNELAFSLVINTN